MELAVPGNAQDDDEVGQDDGGWQRYSDGVDELLPEKHSTGVVAVHRRGNLQTLTQLQPDSSPINEQLPYRKGEQLLKKT